jgi:putative peptidoglycan lipid II flippase
MSFAAPLRFAFLRVVLTTILGYLSALPLPRALGIDPRWGVAGLTISAGVASWLEFTLLRHALNRRIGATGLAPSYLAKLWTSALFAASLAWLIHHFLPLRSAILAAFLVLIPYGLLYFASTLAFQLPEARAVIQSALARLVPSRRSAHG